MGRVPCLLLEYSPLAKLVQSTEGGGVSNEPGAQDDREEVRVEKKPGRALGLFNLRT